MDNPIPLLPLGLSEVGVPIIDAVMFDVAQRAMSAKSWRALRADLKVFGDWAKVGGFSGLRASPQTVAAFLRAQVEAGKKALTLARYISSIARAPARANRPDPTRAELVRLELKAQRRELGTRQRQAAVCDSMARQPTRVPPTG